MNLKFEAIIIAKEDTQELKAKIISRRDITASTLLELAAKLPIIITQTAEKIHEIEIEELKCQLVDDDIPF